MPNEKGFPNYIWSHPMWVRGLKRKVTNTGEPVFESHPMWVRGLKHSYSTPCVRAHGVAPYVGAWIETVET